MDPEQRSEALEVLSEDQRRQYLSMVGPDGWCIHYDTGGRRCRIYNQRPSFCRVSALAELFDVEHQHREAFAISCCREQIRVEYGGRSLEMRRFERAIRTQSSPGDSDPATG